MADTPPFQAFADATHLIGQPTALREQFNAQGYLYLRNVVDGTALRALRADIADVCAAAGWLKPDSDRNDLRVWTEPVVEGEEAYFEVYDQIQRLERFHALAHEPDLLGIMQDLHDGRCFPHPLSVARLMFPYNTPWATPPHQDYPNNQGTQELYACWIPLGDCPVEQGPLAIAPGSHQRGVLPLKYALGAGHRQVFDPVNAEFDWVSGPVNAGDVLIFHSLTVHRSMPNHSDRLRLSVDYRYQHTDAALVEQSLLPHFQRQSWDEIYSGWQSRALQYYWRDHNYTVQPWDDRLHDVVDEPMHEQVAAKRQYQRYREQQSQRFHTGEPGDRKS